MKILIIEDEPLILKSLGRLLSARGADVLLLSSGREAIKILATQRFDRIICDLMLQDVVGFDVLEACRAHYSPQELRQLFVLITAYTSERVLRSAKEYGCPILKKPFINLNETIDFFLQREPSEPISKETIQHR